jgi:predicted transport protein
MRLGLVEDDEEVTEVTDRGFWERRASKTTLAMADELFGFLKTLDKDLDLKYNKFYIGLARHGQPSNFVVFRPKKEWLRVEIALDRTDDLTAKLDDAGLDVMDYDARWGKYRVRLTKDDLKKHEGLLQELLRDAHAAVTS